MDNIRAVVGILFSHLSDADFASGKVTYSGDIPDLFLALGNSYITRYTNDEIRNLHTFLKEDLQRLWQKSALDYKEKVREEKWNVFDILYLFTSKVLREEDGEPVCRYDHLLRWNEITKDVDEDMLVTSFLAYEDIHKYGFGLNDIPEEKQRQNFFWKPIIGHDNRNLNRMLEQGMAENHFHMKGSAPQFHVSWIALMNQVDSGRFRQLLKKYDERRLKRNIAYTSSYREDSLYCLWIRAVKIRLYLYFRVVEKIHQDELVDLLEDLDASDSIVDSTLSDLQTRIDALRGGDTGEVQSKSQYDYAICRSYLMKNRNDGTYELLSGERWLMYQVFCEIYGLQKDTEVLKNVFYRYLTIKNTIRSELVQTNRNIGFDNFLEYQNRKDEFVADTIYEKEYLKMAVCDTMKRQHIDYLEARITPKNTVEQLAKSIQKYDTWCKDTIEKFFYVVHFIKERDDNPFEEGVCRHANKRNEVKKQAITIERFCNENLEKGGRIHGIDAASSEIQCRPEVFAQAYRYLRTYAKAGKHNLHFTYHAGEDFLDILSGLRAIDEAILFLNLQRGDRLGHALALGVDLDEWYEKKKKCLSMQRINFLDNLVWLYGKIRKYRIPECEDAIQYIKRRYDEQFRIIYHPYMLPQYASYKISINEYYDAWKLRGDAPELYDKGVFFTDPIYLSDWDKCGINYEYPDSYAVRFEENTSYLYHLYHFNQNVKRKGQEILQINVNPSIVKAAKKVQRQMQFEIERKGIAIETNPSSNCMIGSFEYYESHPITKWYNHNLTDEIDVLRECPQCNVSINTDDQGVFHTSLENEYAYMALALEKKKDEKGNYMYRPSMILNWLNDIREMGLRQSFRWDK